MKINSKNEYDKLISCVVGDATAARFPELDEIFNYNKEVTNWKETPLPRGKFSQHIIDEANEDLQLLADTLTGLGVDVIRPSAFNFQAHDGMYNYCPRDRLLVYGDNIIDTAMMYPCRDMD